MTGNIFCVYEHWRTDNNSPFYVGKGTEKRAKLFSRKDNVHHSRIVKKVEASGFRVEVRIIRCGLPELEAFALEKERIAFWRNAGIEIINRTDGGEGVSGSKVSAETREKLRKAHTGRPKLHLRGRKHSPEHREKISKASKGRSVSPDTREKISAAQRGQYRPELIGRKLSAEGLDRLRNRTFSQEHREKISAAKRGRPKSADHRAKISETLRGRPPSEKAIEALRKNAASRRGVPINDEVKAKISAGWARRRAAKAKEITA